MTEQRTILRRKSTAARQPDNRLNLFATVPLGAEELTAAELGQLGAEGIKAVRGGVSFNGNRSTLYRSLLQVRTASRILLQLGQFPCGSPQELYDGMRSLPWGELLTPTMTLAIDCTVRDSAITHSHFAALKAKDAIVDLLRDTTGSRPNIDTKTPDLRINLHIAKNQASVSLDASGDPLDRRGGRRAEQAATNRMAPQAKKKTVARTCRTMNSSMGATTAPTVPATTPAPTRTPCHAFATRRAERSGKRLASPSIALRERVALRRFSKARRNNSGSVMQSRCLAAGPARILGAWRRDRAARTHRENR